ncbi:MAG: integrase catalytic domain-containing protein, partial [Bacteroidales bacterium]|nr:integrase catalytic domain-containing protein [Bacteroidales bacterium]
ELQMHKTGEIVTIPIIEKALRLMPKEYRKTDKIFKVLANQTTNDILKKVIKKADINKNISFHAGRHTLGSIGINVGIPIEVVSKILGHKDIKTTLIYAKLNESTLFDEMKKL